MRSTFNFSNLINIPENTSLQNHESTPKRRKFKIQMTNPFLQQYLYQTKNDQKCQSAEIFDDFIMTLGELAKLGVNIAQSCNELVSKSYQSIDLQTIQNLIQKIGSKVNTSKFNKKNWNKDEVLILFWLSEKYSLRNNIPAQLFSEQDWRYISSMIPGKDHYQCMFKWLASKKGIDKKPWTSQQQQTLKFLSDQYSEQSEKKWFQISKRLYLESKGPKTYRSAKQCRQRWSCFLNPSIKKRLWKTQEDILLFQNYLLEGKKWASISKRILGRTENAVKNRFSLLLEKKNKMRTRNTYLSDIQFVRRYLQKLKIQLMEQTKTESNIKGEQLELSTNEQKIEVQKSQISDREEEAFNVSQLLAEQSNRQDQLKQYGDYFSKSFQQNQFLLSHQGLARPTQYFYAEANYGSNFYY